MFTGLGPSANSSPSSEPNLPRLVRFSDRNLLRAGPGRPGKRARAGAWMLKPATEAGDDNPPPDAAIIYYNNTDGELAECDSDDNVGVLVDLQGALVDLQGAVLFKAFFRDGVDLQGAVLFKAFFRDGAGGSRVVIPGHVRCELLGLSVALVTLCTRVRIVREGPMCISFVCPNGFKGREDEVTVCFGTRDLELRLQLIGWAILHCGVIVVFFFVFVFFFDLLALNRPSLSRVLGFTATLFALRLDATVYITGKGLLVLQKLFFRLETVSTFAALVGVDVIGHRGALGVRCEAMVAEA
ncbi:hypothetical protein EYF80_025991 [Liparis tanakae]|uniref:Uncharacterized protein n=1 Tax=Liparis tanakae TaxID=230148 RepID=A0A4Z2HD74_9TELE|nr:hypothetical protein EYF80_025991 [Liparis tanakae]